MPNIKSSKKRMKQSAKRHVLNTARKSAIKTAVKKVMTAIDSGDVDQAKELLKDAEAKISRAKGKGVIHQNTAARKISRLAKKVAEVGRTA